LHNLTQTRKGVWKNWKVSAQARGYGHALLKCHRGFLFRSKISYHYLYILSVKDELLLVHQGKISFEEEEKALHELRARALRRAP